jgi:lipopolysaccharide/colanic/teichoic acid biosynthesis glycosyltransferase
VEAVVHTTFARTGFNDSAEQTHARGHVAKVFVKRGIDVGVALTLLILLLPVLVAIALMIRLTTSGPVLFRQQRVGRAGQLFWFYKFRTMFDGSDPSSHRQYYQQLIQGGAPPPNGVYKLATDPRITPLGRVLRRFSLDEFPQLLNVLKGDMSLVGPRPPIPYEVEFYGPRELARLSVNPGLTGLWQVSGRCNLNFQEMVELDLTYIANWSLWLDVMILLRTPWAVVSGKGAY